MAPALFLQRPEESEGRDRSEAIEYGRATQQFRHFGLKPRALIAENPEHEQYTAETESDRNKATQGDAKQHRKWIHMQTPLTHAVSGVQCLD